MTIQKQWITYILPPTFQMQSMVSPMRRVLVVYYMQTNDFHLMVSVKLMTLRNSGLNGCRSVVRIITK